MSSTLTVIMTHFNGHAFLGQAVSSILSQTFKDFTIFFVDDSSTDERWFDQVRQFNDNRLKIFQTSENVGPYRIKNKVLSMVDSDFLAFHDSDDWSNPWRFEYQIEALRSLKMQIVGSNFYVVDANSKIISKKKMPSDANFATNFLLKTFSCHHPTMMLGKSAMAQLQGFDGCTRVGADTEFILRASKIVSVKNLQQYLYYYRSHPLSLTNASETGFKSSHRKLYFKSLRQRQLRSLVRLDSLKRQPNLNIGQLNLKRIEF